MPIASVQPSSVCVYTSTARTSTVGTLLQNNVVHVSRYRAGASYYANIFAVI